MSVLQPLFNKRILNNFTRTAKADGVKLPPGAQEIAAHWTHQLNTGALDRLTESQVEQTFNNEVFGKLLGYRQIGEVNEATLMPKATGTSGRDTPDFVLGRFEPLGRVEEWVAVGEIKDSRTDLDQPQASRKNKETPVEQGFRYANRGRPGIDWVIISNFREIRLYKNGYTGSFHSWKVPELREDDNLFEFYILLRPDGLLSSATEPLAYRVFKTSISAGHGFYVLYKQVQQTLINHLRDQSASTTLSVAELYGKTYKLLNRVLFAAFCEDHPSGLLPSGTLRRLAAQARQKDRTGVYWDEYRHFFNQLNIGGGTSEFAINAFNRGLFASDPYFENISIDDRLFTTQFQAVVGRRKGQTITGIFGFDVYDFAEDLTVQALGAIFEQSLKDIPKGRSPIRGFGEIELSSQRAGGVYYTPGEITSYIIRRSLDTALNQLESEIRISVENADVSAMRIGSQGRRTPTETKKDLLYFSNLAERLKSLRVLDPACGSGAFLVEALRQLQATYEKTNRAIAELAGSIHQPSLIDLDRLILRHNLHGIDILAESVEITRLSVWLRTAKRGEKLESLEKTILVGDSLKGFGHDSYDMIVGNPPWGADLDGWTRDEIVRRFPDCGEERDSFAIFVIRAWELLRAGGVLGFILPNSWLTMDGYAHFRRWLLENFEIIEIANVWKVFRDVNHDACILIARKRNRSLDFEPDGGGAEYDQSIRIHALPRGSSEPEKLERLAEATWFINHDASHRFLFRQPRHRFETIYPPKIADELDKVASACRRLQDLADVTVGIQVYHHSRVDRDFIKRKGFHSTYKKGSVWHPFIEANDVQRYYSRRSHQKWLEYSEKLHDKRDLEHYARPRILIQQMFWKRISGYLEIPDAPSLYLNTVFAIFNPREVELSYLLGIINSRFVSATYERRANRLLGDKFPKVSKLDLATIPIPMPHEHSIRKISKAAVDLQDTWSALRQGLEEASAVLSGIHREGSLAHFDRFWEMTENQFVNAVCRRYDTSSMPKIVLSRECYISAKATIDRIWYKVIEAERLLEDLVKTAYRIPEDIYNLVCDGTPEPSISSALFAMRE